MIVHDIVNELKQGRTPIVLTKLKEHILLLADMLKPHCKNIIVLMGTVSVKERRLAMERLESIHPDEPMVIVATGKFVGEGFNCPRLDTLFIALPVSYQILFSNIPVDCIVIIRAKRKCACMII